MTYNTKILSNNLHLETELPGSLQPLTTHQEILTRYKLAAEYAANKNTLEIGCSSGIGCQIIENIASNFIAGEYSKENLELLRLHYQSTFKVIRIDAHHLPFASNNFDLIFALAMIYYLQFEVFLKEAHRVLNKSGVLLFCISNKDIPGFVAAPFTTKYYSVPEINKILNQHGFSAKFLGGFKTTDNYYIKFCKAIIKNFLKKIIFLIPNGPKLWHKIRLRNLGKLLPLPNNVNEINYVTTEKLMPINSNVKNKEHKIIYVIATKVRA